MTMSMIKQAAIIGASVTGSGIAAHVAMQGWMSSCWTWRRSSQTAALPARLRPAASWLRPSHNE